MGNNLTNISFASLSYQIKFMDILKYYKQNLAQLTSAFTPNGKASVKNSTKKFLCSHDYFRKV